MLIAGLAVGFDPNGIDTFPEALAFWIQSIAGIAVIVTGLVRAKNSFEAAARTEAARDRLAEPYCQF